MRVCRFDVKVGEDAVVVVKRERNSDVKEVNGCGGGFVGKFDNYDSFPYACRNGLTLYGNL